MPLVDPHFQTPAQRAVGERQRWPMVEIAAEIGMDGVVTVWFLPSPPKDERVLTSSPAGRGCRASHP
jgi:hypothetical protein